ncbi:3'-5' exonuclease [Pectinatus brassicae]|uniref:Inhibitor of KinA sporulation pathway (Predicted exonuclease) n=1 Tax=Pectinatus brassicae TaxID=862415 RepID=A0A840ULF9_9FIRM|nr:3'-5' exonuclease [Pectinatus brassicae]MBB5335538.1 inhibitor of KinA sporulation pathway (predicted exonuclease) [Pectinatus brassicae]
MKYIVLDLEMNPIINKFKKERRICKNEVVEIGAVLIDENYNKIAQYCQYVKPQYNEIAKRYEELTGVTNELVSNAPDFAEAMQLFCQWQKKYCSEEEIVVYAWSENDRRQLDQESVLKQLDKDEYSLLICPWYDLQKEYCSMLGLERMITLKAAVGAMGEDFVGRMHDALWDAENTARIFILSRNKDNFKKVMRPVLEVLQPSAPMTYSLGDMFADKLKDLKIE